MFHPARPPLMWSSVAICRAIVNGSAKSAFTVAMNPMCSVTWDSALNKTIGSHARHGLR